MPNCFSLIKIVYQPMLGFALIKCITHCVNMVLETDFVSASPLILFLY